MCVLVVEDNELIRLIAVEELTEAGFRVAEAVTADEALRSLEQLDPPLSLLITDIHMPGATDGIALARHVTERHPGIPIIFTTGHPGALQAFGTLKPGQFLVRKPYSPHELIKRATRLLSAA